MIFAVVLASYALVHGWKRTWRAGFIDLDPFELVGVWLAEHEASSPETAWVDAAVNELVRRNPLAAWSFILDAFGEAESPRALGDLAAGPLEELLVFHGGSIIHRIEEEARRNPRFAEFLEGIWQNAIDDRTWARLCKARAGTGRR